MGFPIQLRLGAAIPNGETSYVGEPFWDPIGSRFGVFNNRSGEIEWYPTIVGDRVIMNPGQRFTSYTDVSGQRNNLVFDFSEQNEFRIVNELTDEVYALFGPNSTIFNNPVTGSSVHLGILNRALNGNLSVRFQNHTEVAAFSLPQGTGAYDFPKGHRVICPNWVLWNEQGQAGMISASFDDDANYPFDGCAGALKVTTFTHLENGGVRTYIHGFNTIRKKTVTASVYITGPLDHTATFRAYTDLGTECFSEEIVATGSSVRISATFTVPDEDAKLIWVDVLHNPSSGNGSGTGIWQIAGFQVEIGSGPSPLENRPRDMERALCLPIYAEGTVYVANGDRVYCQFPTNFTNNPYLVFEKLEGPDVGTYPLLQPLLPNPALGISGKLFIQQVNKGGFLAVHSPGSTETHSLFRYVAADVYLTEEML